MPSGKYRRQRLKYRRQRLCRQLLTVKCDGKAKVGKEYFAVSFLSGRRQSPCRQPNYDFTVTQNSNRRQRPCPFPSVKMCSLLSTGLKYRRQRLFSIFFKITSEQSISPEIGTTNQNVLMEILDSTRPCYLAFVISGITEKLHICPVNLHKDP